MTTNQTDITVTIIPNDNGNPPGKLADAELVFAAGPLAGMRLQGFAIWERRTGTGRNVTFPARQYSVNGERRSFALLRPVPTSPHVPFTDDAQVAVRDLILNAFEQWTGEQRSQDAPDLTNPPTVAPPPALATIAPPTRPTDAAPAGLF